MSYNEKYLMENLSNPADYFDQISRRGLTDFPPCIISCAITGQNQGKESNPNLPESIEEQVEQTYQAYQEGASLVHIHARDKNNLALPSKDYKDYIELNYKIREKCPDIIINNTVIGGTFKVNSQSMGQQLVAPPASPEVGSIDITNYTWTMLRKKRHAPFTGRDEDELQEMQYTISKKEVQTTLDTMRRYGVKPEFELFDLGDLQYLRELIRENADIDKPYWVQMVLTPALTYQTPDFLLATTKHVPRNTVLGIVATGPAQFPLLSLAVTLGCHVRVGMEDGFYIRRGELAKSNAQLVKKIVRMTDDLGRKIATPEEAREILNLGGPRKKFGK